MNSDLKQVWSWKSLQRSTDSLMNKAYIFACGRLVAKAFKSTNENISILDVGAGSGLVLRHIHSKIQKNYNYLGIDLSEDGLQRLLIRAEKLEIQSKVKIQQNDISVFNPEWKSKFEIIFSNFCLYTIKDQDKRISALKNISYYLKDSGEFHIALPSEYYSASGIATQCTKDEFADQQNLLNKIVRLFILVPYQWKFVLTPIEAKVNSGEFTKFTKDMIKKEFELGGLKIKDINLDYGNCGYHISGCKIK